MNLPIQRKTNWLGVASVVIVALSFIAGSAVLSKQLGELRQIESQKALLEEKNRKLEATHVDLERRFKDLEREFEAGKQRLKDLSSQVGATESLFSEIQQAETAYINKQWIDSSDKFCKAQQKLPDFSHIAVRCGWTLYLAAAEAKPTQGWQDLLQRSIAVLQGARERDSTNQQATYHLGLVMAWSGNDLPAFDLLKQVGDEGLRRRMLAAPQLARLRNSTLPVYAESRAWFAQLRKDATALDTAGRTKE